MGTEGGHCHIGRGRLRLLLATSSMVALLVGGGAPPAYAGSCVAVTGPGGFTNNGTVTCISVTNSAISGNVVNSASGTINAGANPGTKTGIIINNSTINGAIINAGQITAVTSGNGISVVNNAVVNGGISNSGTISSAVNATGIAVANVSTFGGGISNGGTINVGGNGILVGATGFVLGGPVSTFSGGINNSSTITAGNVGIFVGGVTQFGSSSAAGGISNSGTISAGFTGIAVEAVQTFFGDISNGGTISAGSDGILVDEQVSNFIGNIINAGSITAAKGIVVGCVCGVSTFTGSILNTGAITASGTGILITNVRAFAGGITNNSTISAGSAGIVVSSVNVFGSSSVQSGVTNNGTITAGSTGILVGGVGTFTGNVSNSGIIHSSRIGIVLGNLSSPLFGGVRSFVGNVANSGTISGGQSGIYISAVTTFVGNVSNSGTISVSRNDVVLTGIRNFTGNVSNSGMISSAFADGIAVGGSSFATGVRTFVGNIVNSGTIVAFATDIAVVAVRTFTGNVSNSGALTASSGAGISVTGMSTFIGSISNSGTISAAVGIVLGCACGVTKFAGNIVNSGTITAAATGILSQNVSTFIGGITNTGTISAAIGIAVTNSSAVSVFDTGKILASGGTAVDLSANAPGNFFTLGPGYSITGKVIGQGSDTFQLGGSGNGSFDLSTVGPQITGFTTFNVVSGTWTATGKFSGIQTWNVNSGTLAGTGTFAGVNVNSGGTLEPGIIGVPGTVMTINGNLTFAPGATYIVLVNGGVSTLVNANGVASLAGAVQGSLLPGVYTNKPIIILDPGTVTGTFSGFTGNVPGFDGTLSYTPNDVLLTLHAQLGAGGGLNVSQQNVANGINSYFNNGGTLPANFFPLFSQVGATLGNSLTQLDGEVAADAGKGAFELMNEFMGLMLDPFVYGRGGPASGGGPLGFAPDREASFPPDVALAYAGVLKAPAPSHSSSASGGGSGWGFDQRWTVWGGGFGGSGRADGDPAIGSNNVTTSAYGFAAGADYHVSSDTILGFALAGSGTNWNLAQALGTGRSDAFQAGVYGTRYFGPAYIGAALAFTNNWFTTNRTGLGDQFTANFQGQSYGLRVEGGYRLTPFLPSPASAGGSGWGLGVTPYAAIQAQDFHTPTYSETDPTGGGFGLTYNAMSATDTRSELGARFDALTAWGATPVQLRARLAWAHDWIGNSALSAAFQALPGSSFVVNGAAAPANSALASAGAELHLTPRWTLLGKFDGEFASSAHTYAGSGTLRYRW